MILCVTALLRITLFLLTLTTSAYCVEGDSCGACKCSEVQLHAVEVLDHLVQSKVNDALLQKGKHKCRYYVGFYLNICG